MNHLRESYSVFEGFIPVPSIQAGREYLAYGSDPSQDPERVYIEGIQEGAANTFNVHVVYESDRSSDQWNIPADSKIFKEYIPVQEEAKPEGAKILGVKKRSLNESKEETFKVVMKPAHKIQIGDDVIYDKKRGSVIGAIGEQWIVQCQYATYTVDSKDLTPLGEKREVYGYDQFKFDEKTQSLLFEQMVGCGIFMGNTPVKITGCNVKYSDWRDAKPEDQIKVMVESATQFFPKDQIRILEDVNSFANPDNYIEGVIVDEESDEAVENVMINAEDYTNTVGDADSVRILRKVAGETELSTFPKALLKTLSV